MTTEPATRSPIRPLRCRRVVLLVVMLNGCLFFNGCEKNNTLLTAGILTPFVEMAYHDSDWFPSELIGIWPWALLLDLAGAAMLLAVIDRRFPRLAAALASRRLLMLLMLALFAFNSVSYFPALWMNAVWAPTMWILNGVQFVSGDHGTEVNKRILTVVARLYLLLLLTGGYLIIGLVRGVCRKYLLISPDRWWQFNLAGLLALMLIFGAGLGLLVRWLAQVE